MFRTPGRQQPGLSIPCLKEQTSQYSLLCLCLRSPISLRPRDADGLRLYVLCAMRPVQ